HDLRADEIQAASANTTGPISVAADWCSHWQEGVYDVWYLRGNCYLGQGATSTRASEAVLWIETPQSTDQPTTVIAYFEAGRAELVAIDIHRDSPPGKPKKLAGSQRSSSWFQRMQTMAPLQWRVPPADVAPAEIPAIYQRGLEQFNPDRRREVLLT